MICPLTVERPTVKRRYVPMAAGSRREAVRYAAVVLGMAVKWRQNTGNV